MKQQYRDYMMQQLEKLLSIDSPSGYTKEVQQYMNDELTRLGYTPENPVKGGIRAHLGGEGDPICLMAHVDTLGAVVDYIKPNGRLMLSKVGGLQANNVETETVRVKTRFSGEYEGTIQLANASAHVNGNLATTQRDFDTSMEVVLDEDVRSKADAEALGILPGDFVCVEPRFTVTKKGYIKSRFLDDKASAAVLLALAKYIRDENVTCKRSIWIAFTVYEEIGHGGASGFPEGLTEMMSVDMGCVGEGLTCTERQVSICAKDGGGPYNYDCVTNLIQAAKKAGADYAVDVYHYYSSDVDVSLRAGYDVRHSLIGPGVYASHGYERTHIDGLTNTFDLLEAYLF
ncbi:MAG: M42 family metallopeptidase [Clostridia bacterium]|nr:M42 family metallopeptidase [Clostridia bacterium]